MWGRGQRAPCPSVSANGGDNEASRCQGEDPGGRSLDLAPGPPQDKKLEGDKRGMSLSDYNGEIRKGGRGGVGGGGGAVFRSPSSKEVGPGEPGPYYDKVLLKAKNLHIVLERAIVLFSASNTPRSVLSCILIPSPPPPPPPHFSVSSSVFLFRFYSQLHCLGPPFGHSTPLCGASGPFGCCCGQLTLPFTNQDGWLWEDGLGRLFSPPPRFEPSGCFGAPPYLRKGGLASKFCCLLYHLGGSEVWCLKAKLSKPFHN